ncbi:MAG: butyrate kinase, partial [FCB group bacterium]
GGLVAYLKTNDANEVEKKIMEGDERAKLIYDAMIYQIAKEIGACSVVLYGKIDAILITGGLAHSEYLVNELIKRVGFLSLIKVYPGEDELQALAEGVYYALKGDIEIKEYN